VGEVMAEVRKMAGAISAGMST